MAAILESLQHPTPTAPWGLIVRHAERPPITDWNDAFSLLLTDQGKADAHRLGQTLAHHHPVQLYHSPVQRCEQTAMAIAEGIRDAGGEPDLRDALFELGGPYMVDISGALQAAQALGQAFIRTWFDGEISDEILLSRHESARVQLRAILRHIRQAPEALSVFVSHDWNILSMREEFLGLTHEEHGWPTFLDGMLCLPHDKGCLLRYQDHETLVTYKQLGAHFDPPPAKKEQA